MLSIYNEPTKTFELYKGYFKNQKSIMYILDIWTVSGEKSIFLRFSNTYYTK
jgi:hypothetical protein